jgi:hypothetical protein
MDTRIGGGIVLFALFGLVVFAGQAGAQPASSAAGGGQNYSGLSGSQALQEQMYEARMKEILGEETQGGQPQGMGEQKGMKGAEESSQKMQGGPGMKGSSPGDRTMGEEKAKGKH